MSAKEEEIKKLVETAAADLAAAEASAKALEENHSGEMSEARGRIVGLEEELKTTRDDLGALEAKLAQVETDYTKRFEQGAADLNEARAQLEAATADKAALKEQITEARGRITSLEETLREEQAAAEAALVASQQETVKALGDLKALYTRYSALGGRESDRGMLLSLADDELRFASGMAVLPTGELPSLDRIAALLTEYPRLTARIEGHTDNAGPDEINQTLSQARADAVVQALVDRGVAAERLSAEGVGESRPIADNATADGRRQNRRVEVYVIDTTTTASGG